MAETNSVRQTLRPRLSMAARREQIIAAAFLEFAAHGYYAAGTAAIAARAGISQPYIYALFPDKKSLFLACHERAMQRMRDVLFEAAGHNQSVGSALERIERAFHDLYTANPTQLMFQLQSHAAASDSEIRSVVRQRFMDMVEVGVRATGASRVVVLEQLARGLLMAVAVALELPVDYRLNSGGNR